MLNYEIENLDSVEESIKGLYEPFSKSGKTVYRLSVEGVKPIDEFNTVYETLKKERDIKDDFEKKYKAFGEYTPEKIQELENSLAEMKAANAKNPAEEYVKQVDKLKADHKRVIEELQNSFSTKETELKNILKEKDASIIDMRLAQQLESYYNSKGYPGAFALALSEAKKALEWDSDKNEFRTTDKFSTLPDWLDNVFFKQFPNMLKDNVSGRAHESGILIDSRIKYFDTKSPDYNLTEQGKLMREDRQAYDALRKKFPIK